VNLTGQELLKRNGNRKMNAIQQTSLMLQMGIDPSICISPKMLRAMWLEKSAGKYGPARKAGARICASGQGTRKLRMNDTR
jgi:hypothetical protein